LLLIIAAESIRLVDSEDTAATTTVQAPAVVSAQS
jgi:hypothetical protein